MRAAATPLMNHFMTVISSLLDLVDRSLDDSVANRP